MSVPLTRELIDTYRHDGAVCLRGVLNDTAMTQLFAAWSWSINNKGPLASPLIPGQDDGWQDLCNPLALPHYREALLSSRLAELAAELWGEQDVWFMYEQVFHKTRGGAARTPWHQDTSYLTVNGSHLLVMWISFEAIPAPLSLEFVRGSHRQALYNTSRFDPSDPTRPMIDSDAVPRLPNIDTNRDAHDIFSFAVTRGDVVVFHPSMLHGGAPTDNRYPERRTLTLRFFGPDARYEDRPGAVGPFYPEVQNTLTPGAVFRHPRFLKLR